MNCNGQPNNISAFTFRIRALPNHWSPLHRLVRMIMASTIDEKVTASRDYSTTRSRENTKSCASSTRDRWSILHQKTLKLSKSSSFQDYLQWLSLHCFQCFASAGMGNTLLSTNTRKRSKLSRTVWISPFINALLLRTLAIIITKHKSKFFRA